LKLSNLLIVCFGFVLLLMAGTTVIGVINVNQVDSLLARVNEVDSRKQRFAINFRGSVHDRAISIRDAVLVSNSFDRRPHLDDIERLERFYAESAQSLDQIFQNRDMVSSQEIQLLNNIKQIEQRTQAEAATVLGMLARQQDEEARRMLMSSTSQLYSQWLASINAFIDYQEASIQTQVEQVRQITGDFQRTMISVLLIAILLTILVVWQLNSYVQRLLGGEPTHAASVIRELADGNLNIGINTQHPQSIMGAVQVMQRDLIKIMSELERNADHIAQASRQLAETAQKNQSQAQTQRLQTEQGASAIHQMSMTIQEVARHSADAARTANTATDESRNGAYEVSSTISSISEVSLQISESASVINQLAVDSEQIGSVVEVIESIAEQTNLLALNAAIEAARAGEHGRGFAVVADEVRALASRSRNSTQDIQTLVDKMRASAAGAVSVINAGKQKVDDSVEQGKRAGESLTQINNSVDSISMMNAQIASATEEQSAVANEISRNFASIQDLSEQSERASDEVSRSCGRLTQTAGELREIVSKFKLPMAEKYL
jgi:methyl-accepting chemotaxis protein